MIYAKNGTAITVAFGPVLNADGTVYTGTLAYTDFRIWKNGTAGALNGSATATHDNQGVFALALTASDISAVGDISVALNKATLAAPVLNLEVLAANFYDSMQGNANINANAAAVGGQTASASGTVTFPNATLASTTNITAGTITTVTNLTNAPTAGDFNATMKTSLNAATPASVTGAVGSVAGAVGSVAGNVGGNVTGSVSSVIGAVGSVTAAVTTNDATSIAAIKAKTDNLPASPAAVGSQMDLVNAPNSTALTAFATAVWAAGTRTLTSVGTLVSDVATAVWGAVVRTLTSGAAPSAATVASAVWEESLSGHTTAGTAGETLSLAGSGGVDYAALARAILAESVGTPGPNTIGQAIAEGALNAGTGQYLKTPDTLVDAHGNPIEGASVFVTADVVGTGTRIRDGQITDSSGNIPGYWLNPGTYYWHAVKPGWTFPGVEFIVP